MTCGQHKYSKNRKLDNMKQNKADGLPLSGSARAFVCIPPKSKVMVSGATYLSTVCFYSAEQQHMKIMPLLILLPRQNGQLPVTLSSVSMPSILT